MDILGQVGAIPGALGQMFQNVGYTQQQGLGYRGFLPASPFGGLVSPAYASGGVGGVGGSWDTGGQVLGDQAVAPPTGVTDVEPTRVVTDGGGGGVSDYEAQARSAIESGYGDYFAQLDEMLNQGLPAQQAAQTGIAESQYTGGISALQPQLQAGQTLLGRQRERTETSQARNLRDLAGNLRNAFMTGNVFLGARGAGDSSAARQYAYALTKLGSRQRGDIMTQSADIMKEIGDREVNLNNIYNAEVNRLGSERDQKIMSIASWFAEQQNALRQAKATGAVAKGQDLASLSQNLLQAALQQLNFVQQEASNRRSALEQWALNNATSIKEVKANLQQVSAFQPALPQAQQIAGQPTGLAGGGFNVPAYGYGARGTEEEQKSLFSNPSWFG